MFKGKVVNNTGQSRHIFKRTVFPGQEVDVEDIYLLVKNRVSEEDFLEWLEKSVPNGWEVMASKELTSETLGETDLSEDQKEKIKEELKKEIEDSLPSKEYLPLKEIDKLTARDIFNLRIKDNPQRIINQIDSVHKLRRVLTMCRNAQGKATLERSIRRRIHQLNETL